ncbi:MAG: ParA family protein, partial [Actinobacteria bacterium]|nr:ParA family protein [Actinomycetota bacterium]
MAKSASEISRLNAKSTIRNTSKSDSEIVTTSSVLNRPTPIFPDPAPLTTHGDAQVISVVNQKGGVGKTTTTINLGAAFAELGRRVLLIDFDPQHSLSVGLNVSTREIEGSIYDLMMDESTKIDDFLLKTSVPGMDMVPAHENLAGAEGGLVNVIAREKI